MPVFWRERLVEAKGQVAMVGKKTRLIDQHAERQASTGSLVELREHSRESDERRVSGIRLGENDSTPDGAIATDLTSRLVEAPSHLASLVRAMLAGTIDYRARANDGGDLCEIAPGPDLKQKMEAREDKERAEAREKLAKLNQVEASILLGLVHGEAIARICLDLGLNGQNAQSVFGTVMEKIGARSCADAVRIGLYAGLS